jgi:uncharacterized phage-associated protein
MHDTLRFRFNLDKLVNALAYFAGRGVTGLTTLKAAKLLYFVDQYHLHHYGRPVTGDSYVAMELGPVPETAYQLVSRIVAGDEIEDSVKARLLEQLSVYRGFWGSLKYPQLRARRSANMDVFSASDVEALDAIVREHGKTPARRLVDLSHEHVAYKIANAGRPEGSSVPLPYDYFFEDAPADLREVAQCQAESYQESRRFTETLRDAGSKLLADHQKLVGSQR